MTRPSRSSPAETSPSPADTSQTGRVSWGALAVLLLAILGTTGIRARLLSLPLERDEGEYAYAGQLILQGHPPYERLYNMKWPGTYYSYALIEAVFGQTIEGIRLGVLIVNVAAIVLVFLITRRLLDAGAAAAAAVAYAALSISPTNQSIMGHATHFVVLSALTAIWISRHAVEKQRPWLDFLAGFFASLTPIMKQPGIVLTTFVVLYWGWQMWRSHGERRDKIVRGAAFVAGILTPPGILLVSLWATHTFDTFWLWTIVYAGNYGAPITLGQAVRVFCVLLIYVAGEGVLFWILAGLGLLALSRIRGLRSVALFLSGLLVFSLLGVFPGRVFRPHYFILALPAVSMLVGAAVFVAVRWLTPRVPRIVANACAVVMVVAPLSAVFLNRGMFFFEMNSAQATRYMYQINPFIESIAVADYIRNHTDPGDRIAVLGSEPQIYFYAKRPSATGHIYTYALVENQPYAHSFQVQMIEEIEAANPKYVVFIDVPTSWLARGNFDQTLINWFNGYRDRNLKLVGCVEIDNALRITYRWDEPNMLPRPKPPPS